MSRNAFTILGSSSGQPQADRACSGYVLQTGESLSLIDCGGGVTSSFLRCKFDPRHLDRVFISHTHSDHCCELPLVIQMLHGLQTHRRLDVFVPDEFVRPLLALLNALYLFPQHVKVDLNIRGYSDGFGYRGDGFELTALANTHMEKAAELIELYDVPNRMQCHSFRVQAGDKSLFYSSDIGSLGDIEPSLVDLDYALVESTHIDLDRLLQLVPETSVGKYVLTHLGNEAEVSALDDRIRAAGLPNVSLAADGLSLAL